MSQSQDAVAKSIIDGVVDLGGAARAAQIDRSCAGDPELRLRVEGLLAAMETDDGFLSAPSGELTESPDDPAASEAPGPSIGPYRIIELLGEGGFGSVFLAEQSEPLRRQVALKIIKSGMDSRQVVARFEAERQALAQMDHPNIARVFDAGATDRGRPYLTMELVHGEPVTKYCDREKMPVRQRLELFRDICSAVQHAHQKGIIHRDLKPSNVLVTVSNGVAIPKVIDFGVAKAIAGHRTDKTQLTEVHQLIGTPAYMSPEQAELSGVDIDTRSDVYTLGVLLYELLTGVTPFAAGLLRRAPFAEFQRVIRNEEPPRPSARLRTLADSSVRVRLPSGPRIDEAGTPESSVVEIAKSRRTEPELLASTLRRDLDWIVLKCLEKDRARRYETVSALAEDIGRYLDHQPVSATPPSTGYKLRKFVRRNRGAVLAGAVVAAALVIAAGVSVAFGLSEARQRKAAVTAQTRAETAEAEAKARADELEQVARFQEEQLSGIDAETMGTQLRAGLLKETRAAAQRSELSPEETADRVDELETLIAGNDFTGMALETLDDNVFQPALAAIDAEFTDQPLIRARLLQTLANTLYELGLLNAANHPQEQALKIRREVLGDDHPDTLTSIAGMGLLLRAQGKTAEAEPYYREALDGRRRVLGDAHPQTLSSLHNMGALLQAQGKLKEAEPFYREALEQRRRILGAEHPDTLTSLASAGYLLTAQGKWDEAEPYYRDALELRRRVLGDDDPHTLFAINNMGALLQTQLRFSEAEAMYKEALERRRRVLGDDHPDTLQSLNNLGNLLQAEGKPEAEAYYREALERRRRVLGDEHPHTLNSIGNLAALLASQGKLDEAEPLTIEALEQRRRLLGDDHPDTLISLNNMAKLREAQGRPAEAEAYYRQVLAGLRRALGDEHPYTFLTLGNLSSLLQAQGRALEAIELLAEAEPPARHTASGGNALRLGRFLIELGHARVAAGQFEAAEANLSEAHEILSADEVASEWRPEDALNELAQLYDAWHAAEPDKGYDELAEHWRQQLLARQALTQPTPVHTEYSIRARRGSR